MNRSMVNPQHPSEKLGVREGIDYRDTVYIGGFRDSCYATRARRFSLIVPGGLPVTERTAGDALSVLHTMVSDWRSGNHPFL
jgi:hypothetical protein